MAYERIYASLYATSLTPEAHERTSGYWYTVTNNAMAHTAFATRAGLGRWLDERGLRLQRELPAQGEHGTAQIVGAYCDCSHLEHGEFESVRNLVLATVVLSNAQYTLGLISESGDFRTVHYLNPNVKTRLVFDYQRTRELVS